jgi:hypothetical protein
MAKSNTSLANDRKLLIELVEATSKLLTWTVQQVLNGQPKPPDNLNASLPEVTKRLKDVVQQLQTIQSPGDPRWVQLADAGLTGPHLAGKVGIRNWIVTHLQRAIRPALKWTNNVLGSLKSVFPPLELVKEYKEGVELVVEHQQSIPNAPLSILGLH